ncbi:MAG: winged helix-turn-helix transcriptional regulator [Candidatus Kariarchaeaceae archaeon]|jgi:DNA-binding HxlR family transcriptional regulator
MVKIKQCPIDRSFHHTVLHKKWTLTILRDMMRGLSHFSDYLKTSPGLSGKVLSERLKDMEAEGLIIKNVVSTTPLEIEYGLTEKGLDMQNVLFYFSMFGAKYYPGDVFVSGEFDFEGSADTFGDGFLIPKEELDRIKKPIINKTEN